MEGEFPQWNHLLRICHNHNNEDVTLLIGVCLWETLKLIYEFWRCVCVYLLSHPPILNKFLQVYISGIYMKLVKNEKSPDSGEKTGFLWLMLCCLRSGAYVMRFYGSPTYMKWPLNYPPWNQIVSKVMRDAPAYKLSKEELLWNLASFLFF